ncbi:MAG: glycosyltransferase [bacterium]|nr:glycosyltransferase [bacterium]
MKQQKKKPKSRDEIAREKIKRSRIAIYGAPITNSTGNGKLILAMAKAFRSAGHTVFTIGLEYNGVQTFVDDIPVLPGFHCERCGNSDKGSPSRVKKMADYINGLNVDYFICVGDPYHFQQMGVGNLNFPEMPGRKAIMYATIDSEGMFCNDNLLDEGKGDYLSVCDKVVSTAVFAQKMFKEWRDLETPLIHEAIDLKMYQPITKEAKVELRKKYRFKEDDFVIYYGGRNLMRKRAHTLLDAAAQLICETDKTYLYLNIPTYGKGKYPDSLNPADFVRRVLKKKYGRDLLEEGRIIFVERGGLGSNQIGEKENAELYQIADVYATTTGGEGFGLMPVESMACGVPVIVPNNSTGPETIGLIGETVKPQDGIGFQFAKGGLLTDCPIEQWVDNGLKQHLTTVENTHSALKYLHADQVLRDSMGKQGREYAEKMFGFELFGKKWNKIIANTLKKIPKKVEEFKTLKVGDEKDGNEQVPSEVADPDKRDGDKETTK